MIICNGTPKTGTHLLTKLLKNAKLQQLDGSLIYRDPSIKMRQKGENPPSLEGLLSKDDNIFTHAHVTCDDYSRNVFSKLKHVFIIRNPRNVAISWLRQRVTQSSNINLCAECLVDLISRGIFGQSIPEHYRKYIDWIHHGNTCVVHYENLLDLSSKEYQKIYSYLQIDTRTHNTFTLGNSVTWTGKPSDWTQSSLWTAEVETAWKNAGGESLEESLGYNMNHA
ncbi:Sulfotransferase domain-containing protein [Pseudovibrio sp. Tun.PSC04-5.I4]|nr:Sulfotransferase domain-containing protein [Pseudovibrio sp. Tun.PSC04-5.I4]